MAEIAWDIQRKKAESSRLAKRRSGPRAGESRPRGDCDRLQGRSHRAERASSHGSITITARADPTRTDRDSGRLGTGIRRPTASVQRRNRRTLVWSSAWP